jgi:hypothetical protein
MPSKTKRFKQQPSSPKKLDETQKECCNGEIVIKSTVQIDIPQYLKDQVKAANDEASAQNRKQLFWTKIATVLVFVYTAVSGCELKVARDTYNASNRPYIGINRVEVVYISHDEKGQQQVSAQPTSQTTSLNFRVEIKNFGPVPGTGFKTDVKLLKNGEEVPSFKVPDSPGTIFPTQYISFFGEVGEQQYPLIQNGAIKMALDVGIEYSWPGGHSYECDRIQYEPVLHSFFNLGSQCYAEGNTGHRQ